MPCYPLLLPRLRKPSPVAAFWGEQGAPELLLLTQHLLLSFLLALGLFKRHPWPWGAGIVSGYDGGAVGFFFGGGGLIQHLGRMWLLGGSTSVTLISPSGEEKLMGFVGKTKEGNAFSAISVPQQQS